jgi:hypothetical protein
VDFLSLQVMLKQFEVIRNMATLSQTYSKHDAFVGVSGEADILLIVVMAIIYIVHQGQKY